MRKIKILLFLIALTLFGFNNVSAIPTLQLDILGGTYDPTTQTIIAPGSTFTLYAYLIPNNSNTLEDLYYISAALVPILTPPGDNLGSFIFNGQTIYVTENMVYGIPPLETRLSPDRGDLSSHGIFQTYFTQFGFQFTGDQIAQYNTQDRAISGGSIPTTGTGMYFASFVVDTSNLGGGYAIHFDLYNTTILNGDVDVTKFAPFSHDAQSVPVPEPSTLLLLGSGLMGAWLFGRKKFKRLG
jgi:hypothetical protein